jgi:hypothetical protein
MVRKKHQPSSWSAVIPLMDCRIFTELAGFSASCYTTPVAVRKPRKPTFGKWAGPVSVLFLLSGRFLFRTALFVRTYIRSMYRAGLLQPVFFGCIFSLGNYKRRRRTHTRFSYACDGGLVARELH